MRKRILDADFQLKELCAGVLDRTCNERIIAAARVALRGQLADEVMLLNLLDNHMTETLGEGVLRCCSTQPWGSALGFQVGMCFGVAVGLVQGKRPRVPRRGRPAVARLAARTWGRARGGSLWGALPSLAAAGAASGHSS